MDIINDYYQQASAFCDALFVQPELGFKEVKTQEMVVSKLKEINPSIEYETFSLTGIKTYLRSNKKSGKTMAFIAEMDAVYAPNHFASDSESGAAHNCGHFAQTAIGVTLYNYYVQSQAYLDLDFDLCFIFVPAEEYLDLDYRKTLLTDNQINYYGGKADAMSKGVFDDIDFSVCTHAIGELFEIPTIELGCDLAGFLYKFYDFIGKPSHAGFDPFSGVNAYNMSTLFNTGLGLARQSMKESEGVRINPVITNTDMSTNIIPEHVCVGSDIRCYSTDYLVNLSHKLDRIAKGSAYALEGEVKITTQMGYLPFKQDASLTKIAQTTYDKFHKINGIINDRGAISAAGDIGDLAYMMPCIQIGFSGFEGTIHGNDFKLVDSKFVLTDFIEYLVHYIQDLSDDFNQVVLYKHSYESYEKIIQSLGE